MPTEVTASVSEKRRRPARVHRKRSKFPSERIVSLNLSKCVSHNLTNLMGKLEISKKHQKKEALIKQGQDSTRCGKEITQKKINEMTGKKFKSLGKRFIKEFRYFSKSNEKYSSGNGISYPQTLRWLKKAELLDNHRITIRDVEVHFINKLKTGYELKVLEFIRFLKSLCEDRGLEMPSVIFKLLKCRKHKKSIKKKKMIRDLKNVERKHEAPEEKVSSIHTSVKESKLSIPLDKIKEFHKVNFESVSAVVPKSKDTSVFFSNNIKKSRVKTNQRIYDDENLLCDSMNILHINKNTDWTDSNEESYPVCYIPELNENYSEETFTDLQKQKTVPQNEYPISINDKDLENILSIEAVPLYYSGKYTKSSKEVADWVTPPLKSCPPLKNKENYNDVKKTEMLCSPKIFQNSASQISKSSNVKKIKPETKLNRNFVFTAIQLDVVKTVKKQEISKDSVTADTEKKFETQDEKESYEYIDSDEADVSLKYKGQPLNRYSSFLEHLKPKCKNAKTNVSKTMRDIKKVDIKIGEDMKSRNNGLDGEASEIVSIQQFNRKVNAEDVIKKDKGNFENLYKINKTIKMRSRFQIPSKNSSSNKIRTYVDRIFNGDLKVKMEENINELEIENTEMSPNIKITPNTQNLQSQFQELNTSPVKSTLSERETRDQKNFNSNIKNCIEKMSSPKHKRKPIKNKRTFTNLPVKRVQKSLQKSRREKIINKMLNNENLPPDTVLSNGRKVTSSKERTMSTKYDKIKSKLSDSARDESENETQILNTDIVDISQSETDKERKTEKKDRKKYKIRKGIRLRKKELKDPVTEIQNQE